jgi:S-(hydroxymethyl)glutathione dehydrogenase / alcohol dehydrogenase
MTARFQGRTMLAAVMRQPGQPLEIEELEIAEPGAKEVLVRMAASGVCHSDWHVLKGEWTMSLPLVLGHEGAGIVEAVGEEVTSVSVGDAVVLAWTAGCGKCLYCITGRPHICENLVGSAYENVMFDGTSRIRKAGEPLYSFLAVGSFG